MSSPFDNLSPTFEGREPNVLRDEGVTLSVVTGGVALRDAGELDAKTAAFDFVFAGRRAWKTGTG